MHHVTLLQTNKSCIGIFVVCSCSASVLEFHVHLFFRITFIRFWHKLSLLCLSMRGWHLGLEQLKKKAQKHRIITYKTLFILFNFTDSETSTRKSFHVSDSKMPTGIAQAGPHCLHLRPTPPPPLAVFKAGTGRFEKKTLSPFKRPMTLPVLPLPMPPPFRCCSSTGKFNLSVSLSIRELWELLRIIKLAKIMS